MTPTKGDIMMAESVQVAVRQRRDARADAAQWRARYMAAHDVLLAVESYVEAIERPGLVVDWDKYRQMRAAFLAYRTAIESGAPLGWAVAEEAPAEVDAEAQAARIAELERALEIYEHDTDYRSAEQGCS